MLPQEWFNTLLTHYTPATLATFQPPRHTKLFPPSGTLHLLFPLPEKLLT